MPYSKISESRIKKLNGVNLTLSQVNWIARVADKLTSEGNVDNPWAVAISQFKKSFHVEGDKWVKNEKSAAKEYENYDDFDLIGLELDPNELEAVMKSRGEGRGVGGPPQGDGGADVCVCPKCGTTLTHEKGTPCNEMKCPKCGTAMAGKYDSSQTVQVQTPAEAKEKKFKTEGGKRYFASDYAYVPDPDKPSTWKLRLVEEPGGPVTKAMLGRAAVAFSPGGFRGNKVQIPVGDVAKVKARIRSEYEKLGVDPESIPPSVQKELDMTNRWITVSTVARKDLQKETFGTEAMDYDAACAKEFGEYPDMRVFHVRGLKIGKADTMYRVGKWAVDEGYFLDDEFSQTMKEEIQKNTGKWKVSRGFGVVEATGLCHSCGAGLRVTPYHDIIGFVCPVCKEYHAGHRDLKELKFTKTRTFDITVTDIPAVPWTSVSAYSLDHQEE